MLLLKTIFKLYILHSKIFFHFNRIFYWNITTILRIDIVQSIDTVSSLILKKLSF